jgi:tetratricopeptide (TPR) repeat protein
VSRDRILLPVVTAFAAFVIGATAGWAAFADNKKGWTLASAAAAGVIGAMVPGLAQVFVNASAASTRRRQALQRITTKRLPGSVVELLRPQAAVIGFLGRSQVLRQLQDWVDDSDSAAVRLVIGPGGTGKTRLAHQFARGQQALWVHVGGEKAALEALGPDMARPLLLIIDYAEARDRKDLAVLMCAAQRDSEVRVLLLARAIGPWWDGMSASYTEQAHLVDALTIPAHVIELTAQIGGYTPTAIVTGAAAEFALHLNQLVPTLDENHVWDPETPVLRLHADALLAVLDGAFRADGYNVLTEVLRHETRYWRATAARAGLAAEAGTEEDATLRRLVGVAALLGADNSKELADLVTRVVPPGAEVGRYERWLRELYPATGSASDQLGALQPDTLAEHLAVDVCVDIGDDGLADLVHGISQSQAVRALTVLGRAATRDDRADRIVDALIALGVIVVLEAAIQVAPQFPKFYSDRVAIFLAHNELTPTDIRKLAANAYNAPFELIKVTCVLYEILIQKLGASTTPANRLLTYFQYASALRWAGQYHQALENNSEALTLWTEEFQDVASGSIAVRSEYISALSQQAVLLALTGNPTRAEQVSAGVLDLVRQITSRDSNERHRLLADVVTNHALRLYELGRTEDALKLSSEAVDLRRLTNRPRDSHDWLGFAQSLDNHALYLASLNEHQRAVGFCAEAVAICREHVLPQGTKIANPEVALMLGHLGDRLADADRLEEALVAYDDAVGAYRNVVDRQEHYGHYLAVVLGDHSSVLVRLGRFEEALQKARESRRLLTPSDSTERHLKDVAYAINAEAGALAGLVRHNEALKAYAEAVDFYKILTMHNRKRYLNHLLHAFRELIAVAGRAGMTDRAETAAREYRALLADTAEENIEDAIESPPSF